jgi:cellobiose phosphorylase
MNYGYFDDINKEYVITDPRTPVKWINYIGSLAFGGFVDQTGGALICKEDPALNRITRYIPQLPASDFKGETIYLRIHKSGSYRVFSPFFVPTLDPYDRFECRIGLGYTRLVTEFYGLRNDATIFVPLRGQCELRDIKITNLSCEAIEVDAIPLIEYTHPDALKQFTNADWVPQTMQSQAVQQIDGHIILIQYPFMNKDTQLNYFTSNLPVASFETRRSEFLGDHEYGTWSRPLALLQAELFNGLALRGDNIAALLHPLGLIGPRESRRLVTQLGQSAGLKQALVKIDHYRQLERVEAAYKELKQFWTDYLSAQNVKTADPDLDRMVNIHNPRQCYTTFNWSRYLSLYQPGLGTRGIGMRDSAQDLMAVIESVPGEAKVLLRKLLQAQKRNGSTMHQFNPLTLLGSEGDALEREDRPHYYSDDHLWLVLAVTAYLKETGNYEFLQEKLPYYEKDRFGHPQGTTTVLKHIRSALSFSKGDAGAHGLPRLGFADWNDTVNLASGAESVFSAELYGKALLECIELAEFLGDQSMAETYQADYQQMKKQVNEQAWDGDWYVSYIDSDGSRLGSKTNTCGQIYSYTQAWAVISEFAPPERSSSALASVYERLNTRCGVKLSAPGFNGFDSHRGGITTYPPGAKENGGIFLHTNPWMMIAEAMTGNGARAYQYYCQVNPASKNDQVDEFECEPYVYPQNILGDEHVQFGLARNSWLSGTASWAYQAVTQYILGVRPTYFGLKIDPCIPAGWDEFSITRRFRGTVYHISVKNPRHVSKGVYSLAVDREIVENGSLIPIYKDQKQHKIEVVLG